MSTTRMCFAFEVFRTGVENFCFCLVRINIPLVILTCLGWETDFYPVLVLGRSWALSMRVRNPRPGTG